MRIWILRTAALLAVAAFAFLLLPADDAGTQVVAERYLSLEPPAGSAPGVLEFSSTGGPPVPPDCSTWHELYPAFCATSHQAGYDDSGGSEPGCIDVCDNILLDGVTWHIKWVGPTYYMTCFEPTGGTQDVIYEPDPDAPNDPANPVCENWVEIWPNFGETSHIDDWNDTDGSGTLTPCDEVFSGGLLYHIDDIRVNIIIEPGGTPVEESTWGSIKQKFQSLIP